MTEARIDVDRLPPGATVEVVLVEDFALEGAPREPHRHDYHELIWVESGSGEHLIDGAPVPVEPETLTIIGRGQVHVFRDAQDIHGAVIRVKDELLLGGSQRVATGCVLAPGPARVVHIPPGASASLKAVVGALHDEVARPQDPYSDDITSSLVSTLLLWLERWVQESAPEGPQADDGDLQLYRRFVQRLEAEFAAHHDARHYADALAVPLTALSKALQAATGKTTKEQITDRVMLEAQRLLRFTDQNVGEVAFHVGFGDPLYFSRAFKRHAGMSPLAYREAARGSASSARGR